MKLACCQGREKIAKHYMDNALNRTLKNPWDSLIYGVALTMALHSEDHPEVIKALKKHYPDPETTRELCSGRGEPYDESLNKVHDPHLVHRGMCDAARLKQPFPLTKKSMKKPSTALSFKGIKATQFKEKPGWEHFKRAIHECDREELGKHTIFTQDKGRDMLLLESGCQVPVMDVWMIRKQLNLSPDITREEEAEANKQIAKIKETPWMYDDYRNQIIEEAKECGRPVGEYHVGCWLGLAREGKFADEHVSAKYLDDLIRAI